MNSLPNINIVKQTVQAKSRTLSARWTFEDHDVSSMYPGMMGFQAIGTMPLTELIKKFYASNYGIEVPIYENFDEAWDWLKTESKTKYVTSSNQLNITPAIFSGELKRRWELGNLNPTRLTIDRYSNQQGIDLEEEIMTTLAAEISAEIDNEFLKGMGATPPPRPIRKKRAFAYFYFFDADEALRFKLMWGGE